jgi:hypothetical protein
MQGPRLLGRRRGAREARFIESSGGATASEADGPEAPHGIGGTTASWKGRTVVHDLLDLFRQDTGAGSFPRKLRDLLSRNYRKVYKRSIGSHLPKAISVAAVD